MDTDSIERLLFPRSGAPICGALFNALCEHPYGLTSAELIWKIWKGKCEPNWPGINVRVAHINQAAKKHRAGLRIRGRGGPGSKYLIHIVREP